MSRMKKGPMQKMIVLCLSFSLLLTPFSSYGAEAKGSILTGKIFGSDGTTPLSNAIVRAYHIESGKLYNSAPSDSSGSYTLSHLPYGYYDIAVETKEGLFVSTQAINIPPDTKIAVSFALTSFAESPKEWWEGKEKPQIPATGKESSGIAKILEKKGGKAFWKSGKGVATILLGSAAALGIAAAGGGDGKASPN